MTHRIGWPGLAQFVADEHPSDRKPCVTPRRVDESEFWRATQRALDRPPAEPAKAVRGFKVGDRVRTIASYWLPGLEGVVTNAYSENDGVVAVKRDGQDRPTYHFLNDIELIPAQPSTGSGAAGGWVTWHGGECPVPGHVRVQVRFRGDTKNWSSVHPGTLRWTWLDAFGVRPGSDIVAYRVVKP